MATVSIAVISSLFYYIGDDRGLYGAPTINPIDSDGGC